SLSNSPILVTFGGNPKYSVTSTDGSLAITARTAPLPAKYTIFPYTTLFRSLDATVVGTVNGDLLNYSLATAATAASGVGSFPIVVTVGSNPNYSVPSTDVQLPKRVVWATVPAKEKTKTYGDDNPALDATVVGTVQG